MVEERKDTLIQIFPTSLLVCTYKDDFKKEFKYIRNLEYKGQQITGAFRTQDSYVLKHPELSKIKEFILESLDKYTNSFNKSFVFTGVFSFSSCIRS